MKHFKEKRLPKACEKLGQDQENGPKTAISSLLSDKKATKERQYHYPANRTRPPAVDQFVFPRILQ